MDRAHVIVTSGRASEAKATYKAVAPGSVMHDLRKLTLEAQYSRFGI